MNSDETIKNNHGTDAVHMFLKFFQNSKQMKIKKLTSLGGIVHIQIIKAKNY